MELSLKSYGVRNATANDIDTLSITLANAFQDDPGVRWIIPTDEEWARCSKNFFSLELRMALGAGIVITTHGLEGVALWTPPDAPPLRISEQMTLLFRMIRIIGKRSIRAIKLHN